MDDLVFGLLKEDRAFRMHLIRSQTGIRVIYRLQCNQVLLLHRRDIPMYRVAGRMKQQFRRKLQVWASQQKCYTLDMPQGP